MEFRRGLFRSDGAHHRDAVARDVAAPRAVPASALLAGGGAGVALVVDAGDLVLDGEGAVVVDALLARLGRAAGEPVGGVAGRAGAERDVKLCTGLEALASHDDDVAGSQAFGRVDGG